MFKKDIPVDCAYCSFGYIMANQEHCICKKYGVIIRKHSCRHFCYNPLLRQPPKKLINIPNVSIDL